MSFELDKVEPQVRVLQLLLDYGADISCKTSQLETPFHKGNSVKLNFSMSP